MRIKLRHYSGMVGAEGSPGQIIDCPDEIARLFIDTCRAELISDTPTLTKAPVSRPPKVELVTETKPKKRGRPRKIGSLE
jgi:hypothetical protein